MPILAAPYLAPVDVSPEWKSIDPTWTGWDGSVWHLSDPASGVLLTQAGTRGLSMPPVTRYTSTSPALAGSRNRGSRTAERDVFWPLFVRSSGGSQAFVDLERAFWATMHPDKPGVWSVTLPDGSKRSLGCRFMDDGNASFTMIPTIRGWAVYGVTLVAEQPYWEGDAIARTWAVDDPTPFFGGTTGGSGPTFYISSGSAITSATIDNPGDVDTFPVYTIIGPTTSVSVGYAGNVVTLGTLAAGAVRIIDTNPDRLTVTDAAGVDKWSELTSTANFGAPIPPGESVPLSLSLVGTGSVSVAITPRYYRAW